MNKTIKNRYDIFNLIHKGMRAILYSTGMSLQHTDLKNPEETISVFEKIYEVLTISNDHASHENKFIFPLIARYNIPAIKEFEVEHIANDAMGHRLKNLMALYHHTVSDDDKLEAGNAVSKAFNEFISFNLHHMNKEEEILNKLLWQHYSDEEIHCIYKAITVSIPSEKITIHGRWVMRGINNNEIIQWLLSYHGSHPAAFQFLLQLAEDQLPQERWNVIQEALCEGEMLPC